MSRPACLSREGKPGDDGTHKPLHLAIDQAGLLTMLTQTT